MPTATALGDFTPSRNGITAVRLVLALAVIASHTVALGGFGVEPLVTESQGTVSLGFLAVIAFFTLSGFLLARSKERTSVGRFVRNRALRILPGYWVSLLFVALVAAPLAASLSGRPLDAGTTADYLLGRAFFLPEGDDTQLRAVFGGNAVNGSLWTLGVELLCYLLLACIPVRWLLPVAAGETMLLAALWAGTPSMRGPETALLLAFVLGVLAWTLRARVILSAPWAVAAGVVIVGGLVNGVLPATVVGVSYLALLATRLPVRMDTDISYGTYVLAYPVQNVLVLAGFQAMGLPVLIALSIVIVLPLAWLSWTFVEQPAMSLRHMPLPRALGWRLIGTVIGPRSMPEEVVVDRPRGSHAAQSRWGG